MSASTSQIPASSARVKNQGKAGTQVLKNAPQPKLGKNIHRKHHHNQRENGASAPPGVPGGQGHIAAKLVDFFGGVNITLGLPIIRTSVDHGTAFDIAGKGIANPNSLLAAIEYARLMAAHRPNAG